MNKNEPTKSRTLTYITALTLFAGAITLVAALAIPDQLAAKPPRHTRYKLTDLGTFGGPQSIIFTLTGPLSASGMVTTCADTAVLDPYYPNNNPYFNLPSGPDPYIEHAFLWKNGTLRDLGVLPGGTSSCGQWINDRGVVVGASANGAIDPLVGFPEINAVRWENGSILNLGTLGGNESIAWGINNRGQIAGVALNTVPDSYQSGLGIPGATQGHAFLWQDGNMRDLGTLGGPDSNVFSVNEVGEVAGNSYTNDIPNPTTGLPTADPFLWKHNRMIDLGTLGGTFGFPNGFNNRSQVVGQSNLVGDHTNHAFFWERGVLTDIGTLGGDNSAANSINEAGEVVGTADLADGTHHAFVWREGTMIDVGAVGTDPCSNGETINSAGQATGTSTDCNGNVLHVFLWENGSIVNLSALIRPGSDVTFTEPAMINDRGEIAGTGVTSDGNVRAALLVPDGDCDDSCEQQIAASQSNAAVAPVPKQPPLSPAERVRTMMRQRLHFPGHRSQPGD